MTGTIFEKKIYEAIDAGKSTDVIVNIFANKKITNSDKIRQIVKNYKWKKFKQALR